MSWSVSLKVAIGIFSRFLQLCKNVKETLGTQEINDGPQKMNEGPQEVDDGPQEMDDKPQETDGGPQEIDEEPREMDNRLQEVDDGSKKVDASVDGNVEPCVGMEFESDKAAKEFYNGYSRRVGFSIRANASYRTKKNGKRNGSVICRTFVCTKEGHHPLNKDSSGEQVQNRRPTIREGCKAMFLIKKQQSGKWFVAKFEKNHNHPLTSPSKVRVPKRQLIDAYKAAEMGLKECVIYVEKGRLNAYRIDTQLVLDYFKRMQAINPAFFYAIEVDQDGCLSNVFWVDSRARNAYSKFGDVVRFDTTYKKDQYPMPFAPFMGVNHHRQSMLFGSALLSDETESTFVWLFQTWLKAMFGRHPKAIITDQDMAMKAAIAKVFPETSHCYCKWDILQKGPQKLTNVYHEQKDFDRVFRNCVNNSETINDFESIWASMLDKYNLKDNDWLKSLYSEREKWVPAYLQGTFLAGMSPMDQSESVNSLFKGFVDSNTTSNEFVKQYELALEHSYEKEIMEDFNTFYGKPLLRTQMPMEEQAANIYTRNIFKKFQEQLVQSLLFSEINGEDEAVIDTFRVSKFDESKVYTVTFNPSNMKASCRCMMWEFEGILCKHILSVFRVKNTFTLPSHFILNRWTKEAKRGDVCNIEMQDNIQDRSAYRFDSLCREAIKYAEEGAPSVHSYKEAMGIMREAMERLAIAKKKIEIDTPESQNSEGDNRAKGSQVNSSTNQVPIRDAKFMKTKCRPLENDVSKSPQEIATKKKIKRCKNCNVAGHTTRTCLVLRDSERNLNLIMGESSHTNPTTFFNANQCGSEDGSATEHSDPRGMFYLSQDAPQHAPITGHLEPRNFFHVIQSGSQYDPVAVHSDPRAMFYATQYGSQYVPITGQYDYGISTDASQYNCEDTGNNLRLS